MAVSGKKVAHSAKLLGAISLKNAGNWVTRRPERQISWGGGVKLGSVVCKNDFPASNGNQKETGWDQNSYSLRGPPCREGNERRGKKVGRTQGLAERADKRKKTFFFLPRRRFTLTRSI